MAFLRNTQFFGNQTQQNRATGVSSWQLKSCTARMPVDARRCRDVNGVKLQGVVTWFDNFCVLLRRDGHSQLVYKHAISTIMPGAPIQLLDGNEQSGDTSD